MATWWSWGPLRTKMMCHWPLSYVLSDAPGASNEVYRVWFYLKIKRRHATTENASNNKLCSWDPIQRSPSFQIQTFANGVLLKNDRDNVLDVIWEMDEVQHMAETWQPTVKHLRHGMSNGLAQGIMSTNHDQWAWPIIDNHTNPSLPTENRSKPAINGTTTIYQTRSTIYQH
jgi:hypothetical protein